MNIINATFHPIIIYLIQNLLMDYAERQLDIYRFQQYSVNGKTRKFSSAHFKPLIFVIETKWKGTTCFNDLSHVKMLTQSILSLAATLV